MADISMTFSDTTAAEARAATFELARVNVIRLSKGEEAFANVKEMIVDRILVNMLPEWIEREANHARQANDLLGKYRDAAVDVRDAVEDIFDATQPQIDAIDAILNP